MSIRQLSLTDFRNLSSTTLDFNRKINFFSGDNGAGKTSLLEAIHVLCQACSFRTHQLKRCINHDKENFLLFGKFETFKIGLSKSSDKLAIRVNGESIDRRSDLVRRSPVQIINSNSFDIVTGVPRVRRNLIDWCLFHVEQEFAENWSLFQHALKQRNRLLKTRKDFHLIDYWDQYLLSPALIISRLREECCAMLEDIMKNQLSEAHLGLPVSIQYKKGWPEADSLANSLLKSRDRDINRGFTQVGIHRDDIVLAVEGRPASEYLSRGQVKMFVLALLIASLKLVKNRSKSEMSLLIDDLHSELDKQSQKRVYAELTRLDLQLFISNIDNVIPGSLAAKEFKLFHVEHGIIKTRKSI